MTLLMAVLYQRVQLWPSAVCFGIAVASKYPYAIIGVALLAHALYFRHYTVRQLFLWGLLAITVFFVLNPYLWPDPVEPLEGQITYHRDYSEKRSEDYRPDKPLAFLANPRRYMLSFQMVMPRAINTVIVGLALLGIIPLLKERTTQR